jgi:hypothetical protein
MKTTYLSLEARDRALAGMRASQLGLSLSKYLSRLIQQDADQAGLSKYLNEGAGKDQAARKEAGRDRR